MKESLTLILKDASDKSFDVDNLIVLVCDLIEEVSTDSIDHCLMFEDCR